VNIRQGLADDEKQWRGPSQVASGGHPRDLQWLAEGLVDDAKS
jgi:hypothetical protein